MIGYFYICKDKPLYHEKSKQRMLDLAEMMKNTRPCLIESDPTKKTDFHREEWHQASLLYLAAEKYQSEGLVFASREYLGSIIASDSINLSKIIEFMGTPRLENDPALCQSLFESAFRAVPNPRNLCDELKTVFEPDSKVMCLMQDTIFAELESRWHKIDQHKTCCPSSADHTATSSMKRRRPNE